jgi:hypothetical protein
MPRLQTAAERPSPETNPPSFLRAITRDALASAQRKLAVARGTPLGLGRPAGGRRRGGYRRSPRPHPSAQTFRRLTDACDPQREQSHRFNGKKTAMARHDERNWVASKGVAGTRRLAGADARRNLAGQRWRAEATALACGALDRNAGAIEPVELQRSPRCEAALAPQPIHGRRPRRSCRVTDGR